MSRKRRPRSGVCPSIGDIIRPATIADAAGCAAVYAPYVEQTAVSFETTPPSVEEMGERIEAALDRYAWLVMEEDGDLAGYAYGGPFSKRAAYQWSCEVSIYLELGRRRTGAGRRLYEALFTALAARGYRTAFAGMTLPNEASVGLHTALGFEVSGTYRDVGWKFERWHDVRWMQRPLGDRSGPPAPLR